MNPVENYFLKQHEPYQGIMLFLREFILEIDNNISEHLKYGIPFYYYKNKPMCFLNILKNTNYVDLAFHDGFLLSNKEGLLFAGGTRKKIKSIQVKTLEEIPIKNINSILKEAMEVIDEKIRL